METIKVDDKSVGIYYGIDLTSDDYYSVVRENIYTGDYEVYNFENLKGDYLEAVSVDDRSNYGGYSKMKNPKTHSLWVLIFKEG